MKNKIKITSLILAVIMLLGVLTGCGSKNETVAVENDVVLPDWTSNLSEDGKAAVKDIISKGKIIVGTSADYAPCEFHTEIDGEDTIVGYEIAYARYIAEQFGVEAEVVDMSFENLIMSLSKGSFDMVIAAMSSTPERAMAVDFSDSYFTPGNSRALIRTEDADKFTDTDSLKGCKIITQKGTTLVEVANVLTSEENIVLLDKVQDEVSELLGGKVDAVLVDYMTGIGYDAIHDDITSVEVITNLELEKAQRIAIQKGNSGFLEAVNYVISTVSEDQLAQWIGESQQLAGIADAS